MTGYTSGTTYTFCAYDFLGLCYWVTGVGKTVDAMVGTIGTMTAWIAGSSFFGYTMKLLIVLLLFVKENSYFLLSNNGLKAKLNLAKILILDLSFKLYCHMVLLPILSSFRSLCPTSVIENNLISEKYPISSANYLKIRFLRLSIVLMI